MPLLYKPRGAPKGNQRARKPNKRKRLNTTVSQETKAYLESMKHKMSPGRLVDAAIELYRNANPS